MSRRANPQKEVVSFNAAFAIGDAVMYAEVIGDPPKPYTTRSAASVLSGHTAVVWLEGKSGCVAVSHCSRPPARAEVQMPERIQLSRAKGWRIPPNTVKVDRRTQWGNPLQIGSYALIGSGGNGFSWLITTAEHATSAYTHVADGAVAVRLFRTLMERYPKDMGPLRGKNLACWCKLGTPCHVDVLLELANQ